MSTTPEADVGTESTPPRSVGRWGRAVGAASFVVVVAVAAAAIAVSWGAGSHRASLTPTPVPVPSEDVAASTAPTDDTAATSSLVGGSTTLAGGSPAVSDSVAASATSSVSLPAGGVVTYSTSPGSDGGAAAIGLPPTNTYPYHSTGPDWAGLNTSDPRCIPILQNQRVLELPDFRGMAQSQAGAAVTPISMYSYCTSGTIIMIRFVWLPDQCTANPALVDRIATQSPSAGTRVSPSIFEVDLALGRDCGVTPTEPPATTVAPPAAPTTTEALPGATLAP